MARRDRCQLDGDHGADNKAHTLQHDRAAGRCDDTDKRSKIARVATNRTTLPREITDSCIVGLNAVDRLNGDAL
ncbi:hypothetical protein DP106_03390 [Halonotius pteroides]|uniref:Uncharacterized protein n=1 Tax=Halonotius pteroides TaxID=268735 RepID=A0A3A6QR27_9EURY|nr:hypothetical protein DP106_03390 [Halonotius pteroides]